MINQPSFSLGSRTWTGFQVLLVVLNLIVFGFLLARILSSFFFPSPTEALLLHGLQEERQRLEAIATGPCSSAELGRFSRGEIGPLPNLSSPPATDLTQPATPSPSISAPTTPPIAVAPGRMLDPGGLRTLVEKSVVRVLAGEASGSGFAIGPKLIVTNRHVVEGATAGQIFVTSKFLGAEPLHARLISSSQSSEIGSADFAVLEMQGGTPLLALGIGTDPKPLDNVVSAGFPGLAIQSDNNEISPDVVFSQGEVSVIQPQPTGIALVIHTANMSPGSSGGPLLNRCGTVVGVNTFVSHGDDVDGRALYSLSSSSLAKYLASATVSFNQTSSDCVSGVN